MVKVTYTVKHEQGTDEKETELTAMDWVFLGQSIQELENSEHCDITVTGVELLHR